MPVGSYCLKKEATSRETLDISSFCQLLGSPAVAIRGEMALCVWFVQPGLTECAGLDGVELDVYGSRYTKVRVSVIRHLPQGVGG